ncbi:hypothetical protein AX17_006583 [Amanita inopinata Kibby_2008]|nr:hypothetical protein AX17_006583 [Amanita inopinata Kibby_2008]
MDDIDTTQIGRYGTISLLKRQEPPTVITAFGIDAEELTFGRDQNCGVRLYYPDVDPIHCKIIFEERKAFLVVLGNNGLLIDGCLVYPNMTPLGAPTTIPLTNNSEIEIHTKRFRFTYPPKELRAALLASPIRPNRALRLSMIQSAQVFSPRPSGDPRENLRLLQSPLKSTFLRSPLKPSRLSYDDTSRRSLSPTKQRLNYTPQDDMMNIEEEDSDEEEIVLVEGDHPTVVEEEKDLVILEDVEVPTQSGSFSTVSSSAPHHVQHQSFVHFSATDPPQTPRRRSTSRNSLHRAVLIRSAQRAILRAEKEQEDEMEEMEVLGAVASDDDIESLERGVQLDEENTFDEDDLMDEDEEYEDSSEIQTEERRGRQPQRTTWRKSLERIWPFRGSSSVPEDDSEQSIHPEYHSDLETPREAQRVGVPSIAYTEQLRREQEMHNAGDAEGYADQQVDGNRRLGAFMTPPPQRRQRQLQQPQSTFSLRPSAYRREIGNMSESNVVDDAGRLRYSLGSGEPRRMLVEKPWRVKDLVVPLKTEQSSRTALADTTTGDNPDAKVTTPRSVRKIVNEDERRAIQERRRSALREIDTFFVGGIPGMGVSPAKSASLRESSRGIGSSGDHRTPMVQGHDLLGTPRRLVALFSHESEDIYKTPSLSSAPYENSSPGVVKTEEEEEELDTRSLLEKMKETVEGMKRRRSTIALPPPTLIMQNENIADKDRNSTVLDLDTSKEALEVAGDKQSSNEANGNEPDENTVTQDASFTLLRTGARKGLPTKGGTLTRIGWVPTVIVDSPGLEDPENPNRNPARAFSPVIQRKTPGEPGIDIPNNGESDQAVPTNTNVSATTETATEFRDEVAPLELSRDKTHTTRRNTRSRSRTASVEPEAAAASARRTMSRRTVTTGPSVPSHGPDTVAITAAGPKANQNRSVEVSEAELGSVRKTRRGQKTASIACQLAAHVEMMEIQGVNDSTHQDGHDPTPTPAPRAKKGRGLKKAATSVPSRHGRVVATSKDSNAIDADDDDDPLDTLHQSEAAGRAAGTSQPTPATARSKGRSRRVKDEEPDITSIPATLPAMETRSGRLRATTVTGDGAMRTRASTKTPATRAGGKKTPSTAPSAISIADTGHEKEMGPRDKENTQGVESNVLQEGTKVRVSRNRKVVAGSTSRNAAAGKVKVEEVNDMPKTRTRARTRTKI